MTTEPTPPIRRRWFQFRLRTLLVLMLVVSLGMGWVMKERRRIAERREGLREFDKPSLIESNKLVPQDSQPKWHVTLFGDDWPSYVLAISGSNVIGDTTLVHLKRLTQLKWLVLCDTQITDAGLVHVQQLMGLKHLYLSRTQVTDVGLVHLNGLTQLEELVLDSTHVTDAGLVHLKGLTQLQGLYLEDTQVTYAGVAKLQAALPNCEIHHQQHTKSPSHKF